eukprot:1258159-Amphidinium_carterae.1
MVFDVSAGETRFSCYLVCQDLEFIDLTYTSSRSSPEHPKLCPQNHESVGRGDLGSVCGSDITKLSNGGFVPSGGDVIQNCEAFSKHCVKILFLNQST